MHVHQLILLQGCIYSPRFFPRMHFDCFNSDIFTVYCFTTYLCIEKISLNFTLCAIYLTLLWLCYSFEVLSVVLKTTSSYEPDKSHVWGVI